VEQSPQKPPHNPRLSLLACVPAIFAAARLKPEVHTLLVVLFVPAVVRLAKRLSCATESVAAKTSMRWAASAGE
jgi:Ca2+/H+ antiporter